ncbi:PREDICTED: uncharacterized protein LOC105563102, partial [Vollenhovia emeryi]|uniref:uncharacterized protein LOC105563102 n=1 Tax=Vollenhovia emeryi TaxID=411798 RepID=UPI0005F3A61B
MVFTQEDGFFNSISKNYGQDYATLMRTWLKTNIKICTATQQLIFLLRCRRHNILPPHIRNQKLNITLHNKHSYHRLTNSQNSILDSFCNSDRSKWIVNICNKQVPKSVLDFLSLGDKFGLPINNKNLKDRSNFTLEIIKNFEINAHKIPDDILDETRSLICNNLNKFLNKNNHVNTIDKFLLSQFSSCNRFLRDNEDVFVTRADKGQVTVVMNRDSYTEKMLDLLNDNNTYKSITRDPIRKITNKLHELIKAWLDNDIISESTYKYLNCTNGNLPRCYGLPKIHKSGYPLRIIVSTIGSPLYNISWFLHKILFDSIPKPKSHIKDGWTFASNIKNSPIKDNELMVSLDVTSLYTNVPKDLIIKGIKKRWNDISTSTKLSLPQFVYAIELILQSTCFSFNNKFFEQIFGTPMGSPLSPILADIIMDDLETHCIESLDFDIP